MTYVIKRTVRSSVDADYFCGQEDMAPGLGFIIDFWGSKEDPTFVNGGKFRDLISARRWLLHFQRTEPGNTYKTVKV